MQSLVLLSIIGRWNQISVMLWQKALHPFDNLRMYSAELPHSGLNCVRIPHCCTLLAEKKYIGNKEIVL